MLQEKNKIKRGYLTENGLAMVDEKSFNENIILLEDVESFSGFNIQTQDVVALDECHLPKLISCGICAKAIGCEWRNGECLTATVPSSNETCPAIKISEFLESNYNYEGVARKTRYLKSKKIFCGAKNK
jgi:hypothetical protein